MLTLREDTFRRLVYLRVCVSHVVCALQQSVVILSRLPYLTLFSHVVSVTAVSSLIYSLYYIIGGTKLSWVDHLVSIHRKTLAVTRIIILGLASENCGKTFVAQQASVNTTSVLSLECIVLCRIVLTYY